MSRLLGQREEFAAALAAARALRMPHGTIVEGLPGSGKSTAARLLAQALLCGATAGDAVEGSCPCSRRVATGQHADLHLIELPEDRQDIPVESVRELQGKLERRPVEGRARVAIVDPADRLNEQGQNALLKTLEEPGADTFLLLVTSRPEALLETVRSRVARLRVLPLDEAAIRAAVTPPPDARPEEVEDAIRGAGGSLGLCRALLDPANRALAGGVARFVAQPCPSAVGIARELLDGASGRTETEQRMATVLRILRARLRLGAVDAVGRAGVADEGSGGYRPAVAEPWISALEVVFDAEQDFAFGIPANQVLEGVLLRLVALLGGGPPAA